MFLYFNGVCWVTVDLANAALVLAQASQEMQSGTYSGEFIPF